MICVLPCLAVAGSLRVAVASNFRPAMEVLVDRFEEHTGHEVLVSYGSTGKHYAQIVNGAPFDAFLAADSERPRLLEDDGVALAGSRFTYATGRLVLWMPGARGPLDGEAVLRGGDFRFLATANPRTAPYGLAAGQLLQHLGVLDALRSRIVRGENIAQAYAYVKSGNAELGLIALSQVAQSPDTVGATWLVPQAYHQAIVQQAVRLSDAPATLEFMDFLQSAEASGIIVEYGYEPP